MMLLSLEPSIIGRDPAGQRATIATHHPPANTIVAAAASDGVTRGRTPTGAATMYTIAKPGSTRNACIIFARNANPSSAPTPSSQRVAAPSSARTRQYADATSRQTSSASGLLNRNISAATGAPATAGAGRQA